MQDVGYSNGKKLILRSPGSEVANDASQPNPNHAVARSKRKRLAWNAFFTGVGVIAGVELASFSSNRHLAAPPIVQKSIVGSRANDIVANGFVVPARSATISSDETGRLVKILVKSGNQVKKGQIVAELDDGRQKSVVEQANAAVMVAQSQLHEAEAALTSTDPIYRRTVKLSQIGFVSKAGLDEISGRRDVLSAHIITAQRQLRVERDNLLSATRALSYRTIRAPFDGLVTQLNAQVGEIVSPISAGSGFTRTGICTLADRTEMFALVELDETLVEAVGNAKSARIAVPALGRSFVGQVESNAYEIDRAKGTGTFRVRIINPAIDLLPNMATRITFSTMDQVDE